MKVKGMNCTMKRYNHSTEQWENWENMEDIKGMCTDFQFAPEPNMEKEKGNTITFHGSFGLSKEDRIEVVNYLYEVTLQGMENKIKELQYEKHKIHNEQQLFQLNENLPRIL